MSDNYKEKICNLAYEAIWRSFNRSISALEEAGAIDKTELNKEYRGVGSKYYDLVTEQMDFSLNEIRPIISEIVDCIENGDI